MRPWVEDALHLNNLIERRGRTLSNVGVESLQRFIQNAERARENKGHSDYVRSYYETMRDHFLRKERKDTSFGKILTWDLLEEMYGDQYNTTT